MNEPATREDLDKAMGVLRGEMTAMETRLRSDLGSDMKAMETRLRSDFGDGMKAMEERLVLEIGGAISRATNVMMEHFSRQFAVLDDKYGDLPPRHDKLRADLDTHIANLSLHARRPAAPAKRTRRPRSR